MISSAACGEIVCLGPDSAPQFYDVMHRSSPQHYFAFDLLWLDGLDLRDLPLLERKRLLSAIVPPQPSPVLYVDHVGGSGVALFDTSAIVPPQPSPVLYVDHVGGSGVALFDTAASFACGLFRRTPCDVPFGLLRLRIRRDSNQTLWY